MFEDDEKCSLERDFFDIDKSIAIFRSNRVFEISSI